MSGVVETDASLTERLMAEYDDGVMIAKYFQFRHLTGDQLALGRMYATLATELIGHHGGEAVVAVRKLLESRDAMLRAVPAEPK